MPALNGYGRIIHFKCYGDVNDEKDNAIETIQEGRFKQGFMHGYCRNFDSLDEGFAEVGFFNEGDCYGKYQSFRLDGTLLQQGIKDGDQLTKEVEIADFMTRNLQSDLSQLDKSKMLDRSSIKSVKA